MISRGALAGFYPAFFPQLQLCPRHPFGIARMIAIASRVMSKWDTGCGFPKNPTNSIPKIMRKLNIYASQVSRFAYTKCYCIIK